MRHYGKTLVLKTFRDLTQVLKAPYRASIIEKLKTLSCLYYFRFRRVSYRSEYRVRRISVTAGLRRLLQAVQVGDEH